VDVRKEAAQNPGLPGQGRPEISLLPRKLHPLLVVPCSAAAGPMTWRAHPQGAKGWTSDDVAPTSLNEGRGEGEAPVLVVVFHLGPEKAASGRWMGRGCWYGQKGERAAQMWKGGNMPFWERARTGFSVAVPKAIALVVPKTSRAAKVTVECISNVIYQNVYLIR